MSSRSKTDSIEKGLERKDRFIQNMKDVMNGKDLSTDIPLAKDTIHNKYNNIKLKKSPEDSLLRTEVENQGKYNLYTGLKTLKMSRRKFNPLANVLFFVPVERCDHQWI
jgi:hypothetical protein